ncbi:MAG: dihydroorotate dehydrogenase-like protein [Planctomycetota bacterium]|nr:dihydroorotate dehydrogenase-like protein [Planctomycetota bacterium]
MTDLSVKYMGIELENPLIVASSSLTGKVDKVKKCADTGAGAVVLKSIFEEQIMADADDLEAESEEHYHPEAMNYIYRIGMENSKTAYLETVQKASEAVDIPVIASCNCVSRGGWVEYARKLQNAGAAGIELNMYVVPKDPVTDAANIEKVYYEVLKDVKAQVDIPVAVKISPFFTNFYAVADKLAAYGASALVLFNRYYHFDIDVDTLELKPGVPYSTPEENALALRWVALTAGRIETDIAATTGIQTGKDVAKQILAGAKTCHIASILYKNGIGYLATMRTEMEQWMEEHGFAKLADFRGKLAQVQAEHPTMYDRFQFIKAFVGLE